MLAFNNDYSHGAHPAVLQALVDTNMEPQPGYGTDAHTERAKQLIREACQAPDADVFFLVGGTCPFVSRRRHHAKEAPMTTSPLANPTATRELLEEFGLATKHRLGQPCGTGATAFLVQAIESSSAHA